MSNPVAFAPGELLANLRPERIEAHLRFLSSHLLEGRGPGSRGGRLAEEYIRATFVTAGLEPAAGSHWQDVPMVGIDPDPTLRFVREDGGDGEVAYGDDFVLLAGFPRESVAVDAELVYVGFGITAPEYGWDDYADVDVRDRVLLIRVNDPGTPDRPDFFAGRALTYYGRWTYKLEEAARRGAAGAILIHSDESAGYGWNVVRSSNTGEQFDLAGKPRFPLPVRGWVTETVGRRLLETAGDAESLLADATKPDFRPHVLPVTVRAGLRNRIREVRTANVVGHLPGTDPDLADSPIVVMAHHDHLGMTVSASGETTIYPGAHDNASGVALVLSIADAFRDSRAKLRHPVLFLATTAEESGLLGSEWYTRNPIFPLHRTVAVLNVDGGNLHGPTRDIAPLGMDRSRLGELVRVAATAEGLEIAPELHPEQGMFFRQDHFPFARAGVPCIAFDHGLDFAERPEGWGEGWYQEFNTTHYHQPTDAFSEDFDYRGAVQQGRVMLRTMVLVDEEKAAGGGAAGT